MGETESIQDYCTKLTTFINGMKALREEMKNRRIVEKILVIAYHKNLIQL